MSYCLNPNCQQPHNLDTNESCQSCDWKLLLKDRYQVKEVFARSATSRTLLAIDVDKPSQPYCIIKQVFHVKGDMATEKLGKNDLAGKITLLDSLSKHPRLPDLLAAFTHKNHQYIIHEYIDGPNLVEETKEKGVCSEIEIWQILKELLPVIQTIHDRNLIHSDIKPENIIKRSQGGIIKGQFALVDLGSVRVKKDGKNHQFMTGTAEYSAPEQIQNEPRTNSDIYSLGVTCLYLLTKVSPFDLYETETDTWVWRHYLKQPVSNYLGRILDKMIARDPDQRYQSVASVLKDIKYKPTATEMWLQKPKNAMTAWAGSVLALLGIILGTELPGYMTARSYHPDNTIPAQQWLDPQVNISPSLALKQSLELNAGSVLSMALSPNGETIAIGTTDGTINIFNRVTGSTLQTFSAHFGPVATVAISPDGQYIASGGEDGNIKIWDSNTGFLKNSFMVRDGSIFLIAFSPDGNTIATISTDKTIKLWDVNTGSQTAILIGHTDDIQSIAFSPDGQTLASGSSDGVIKLWNWRSGQAIGTLWGHSEPVFAITISPDGETLASGSLDSTIKLWDISKDQTGNPVSQLKRTLQGHNDKIFSLAFNPNSETLASADFSGSIIIWNLNNSTPISMLKGHNSWVKLSFDSEGQNLVSGSGDDIINVWYLLH